MDLPVNGEPIFLLLASRFTLTGKPIFFIFKMRRYDMATKNTKKMRGDKIQIGVWISKDTYAKATEIAKKKEFTFSDILRIALKEYIANHND